MSSSGNIRMLSLNNKALYDKRIREVIKERPLDFIATGLDGFFRFPIDDELRNYIVSNNLHSNDEYYDYTFPSRHQLCARFNTDQMLRMVVLFDDNDGDKEKKGIGALYPILQTFSRFLDKPISVRKRGWNILDYPFAEDSFEAVLTPKETTEERRKYLSEIVASITKTFLTDGNVVKVLPFGSQTYGNPIPGDLDFIVLLKSREAYQQEKLLVVGGWDHIALIPAIACCEPTPEDYENLRIDSLLRQATVESLRRLVKLFEIKLDSHFILEETFDNPNCCAYHKNWVDGLKEEYGQFWLTNSRPENNLAASLA